MKTNIRIFLSGLMLLFVQYIVAQPIAISFDSYQEMPQSTLKDKLDDLGSGGITFVGKNDEGNYVAVAMHKIIREHQWVEELVLSPNMIVKNALKVDDINTSKAYFGKEIGKILQYLNVSFHVQGKGFISYGVVQRFTGTGILGYSIEQYHYHKRKDEAGTNVCSIGRFCGMIESGDRSLVAFKPVLSDYGNVLMINLDDGTSKKFPFGTINSPVFYANNGLKCGFSANGMPHAINRWGDEFYVFYQPQDSVMKRYIKLPLNIDEHAFPLIHEINDDKIIISTLYGTPGKYATAKFEIKGIRTFAYHQATKKCEVIDEYAFEKPWKEIAADPACQPHYDVYPVDGGTVAVYEYGFKRKKAEKDFFDRLGVGELGHYFYVGISQDGKIIAHKNFEPNYDEKRLMSFTHNGKFHQLSLVPDKDAQSDDKFQILLTSWGKDAAPTTEKLCNVPSDKDNYDFIRTGKGKYDIVVTSSNYKKYRFGTLTLQ